MQSGDPAIGLGGRSGRREKDQARAGVGGVDRKSRRGLTAGFLEQPFLRKIPLFLQVAGEGSTLGLEPTPCPLLDGDPRSPPLRSLHSHHKEPKWEHRASGRPHPAPQPPGPATTKHSAGRKADAQQEGHPEISRRSSRYREAGKAREKFRTGRGKSS